MTAKELDLIKAYKEYINFLGEEYDEVFNIANIPVIIINKLFFFPLLLIKYPLTYSIIAIGKTNFIIFLIIPKKLLV